MAFEQLMAEAAAKKTEKTDGKHADKDKKKHHHSKDTKEKA